MNTRALLGRAGLLAPLLLAACTVMPQGPTAMVLPGTGKSFEQFRGDDMQCRSYAQGQLGGSSAQQAGVDSGVRMLISLRSRLSSWFAISVDHRSPFLSSKRKTCREGSIVCPHGTSAHCETKGSEE